MSSLGVSPEQRPITADGVWKRVPSARKASKTPGRKTPGRKTPGRKTPGRKTPVLKRLVTAPAPPDMREAPKAGPLSDRTNIDQVLKRQSSLKRQPSAPAPPD